MSHEALFELVQKVLDGEATPAERSRLDSAAARSPELQREIEATRDLIAAIDACGAAVAPPRLQEEIMGRIRARISARGLRPVEFPDAAARMRRRQWLVAAAAVAAALAVFVTYPLVRPALTGSEAGASGSMVATTSSGWTEVARAATPSNAATATLRANGATVRLDVKLTREATITIRWNRAGLTALDSVSADSEVSVVCPAGVCPPLLFRRNGAPAEVTIFLQGGETLTLTEMGTGR